MKKQGYLITAGLLACLLLTYLLFKPEFDAGLNLIMHEKSSVLANYLASFGTVTVFIFLFLFIINVSLIFFPLLILDGAAGMMYGTVLGTALAWAGEMAGMLFVFVIVRQFISPLATRYLDKKPLTARLRPMAEKNGFRLVLLLCLIPLWPAGTIAAFSAVCSIALKDFILATLAGTLPIVIMKVFLGEDLLFFLYHLHFTRLLVIVIPLIMLILYLRHRKVKK